MKKISLIAILFSGVLFLENCKKDTVVATATSTSLMIANIRDSSWYTDTVTASLKYDAVNKTKTFTCVGSANNKKISISLITASSSNTSGFPLGTYNVDATPNLQFALLTPQKAPSGNIEYLPVGTVYPGSGSIIISAVDSVKNQITGTFSFTTRINNPDNSVTITQVSIGGINKLPYTFSSN